MDDTTTSMVDEGGSFGGTGFTGISQKQQQQWIGQTDGLFGVIAAHSSMVKQWRRDVGDGGTQKKNGAKTTMMVAWKSKWLTARRRIVKPEGEDEAKGHEDQFARRPSRLNIRAGYEEAGSARRSLSLLRRRLVREVQLVLRDLRVLLGQRLQANQEVLGTIVRQVQVVPWVRLRRQVQEVQVVPEGQESG